MSCVNEAAAPRHRTGADRRAVASAVAPPPVSTRGAHRAPAASRRGSSTLARIGQAGIAAALVVAFGLTAVNPVEAAPSQPVAAVPTMASEERDRLAAIEQTRDDLATVAAAVLARVDVTRLDAVQAQVPDEQLAAFLALADEVYQLNRRMSGQISVRSSYLDRLTPADPLGSPALSGGTDLTSSAADVPSSAADPSPSGADPSSSPSATTTIAAGVDGATTVAAAVDGAAADPSPAATVPTPDLEAFVDPASGALAIAGAVSPTFVDPDAVPLDAAARDDILAALPQTLPTDDTVAAALRDAVVALATAAADVSATAEANRVAAAAEQAAKEAAAKEAAEQAAALAAANAAEDARRKALPRSAEGYLNGEIPASALCHPTSNPSALLRCDAAKAFDAMDAAYAAAFGTHLVIGSSYRTYAEQVVCRATKGYMCADPGTSNHGWGLAVDLAGEGHHFGTPTHLWLEANAATYGWSLPAWAVQGGGKEEPWHWEFGV